MSEELRAGDNGCVASRGRGGRRSVEPVEGNHASPLRGFPPPHVPPVPPLPPPPERIALKPEPNRILIDRVETKALI